jgi:hypothetical protein
MLKPIILIGIDNVLVLLGARGHLDLSAMNLRSILDIFANYRKYEGNRGRNSIRFYDEVLTFHSY